MLVTQIRFALRVLSRKKLYAVINCFGLAVGIGMALVIWKYAEFESSYDSWQPNSRQLYRTLTAGYVNGERVELGFNSGHGQGPAMKEEIPEVIRFGRLHMAESGGVVSYTNSGGLPDQSREEHMYYADASFVSMMGYKFISGDPNTALSKPASALLTKATSKRYFGDENAIGKELTLTTGYVNKIYTVVGVLDGPPQQSHLSFDILLSMHEVLQLEWYSGVDGPWNWTNFTTYVELYPGIDPAVAEGKLPALVEKYRGKVLSSFKGAEVVTLQPIADIHLTTNLDQPLNEKSDIQFLLIISVLIILTAWLNFVNLSTARATERAREVGVRKTIGARRGQLISQFMIESLVVNSFAMSMAIALAWFTFPFVGDLLDKDLQTMPDGSIIIPIVIVIFLVSTLATGIYPAFVLSSFKPALTIKGSHGTPKGITLRKALVIVQFTVSLVLIAGTFAVQMQVNFLETQNTGFNIQRMLVVKGPWVKQNKDFDTRLFTFKDEMKKLSFVKDVASSSTVPGGSDNSWGATSYKKGAEGGAVGMIYFVDRDFPQVYGLKLIAGREWDPALESDMRSVLINEAAVTAYGFDSIEDALHGQLLVSGSETLNIIGVLKNYHWNSLKNPHTPIVLWPAKIYGSNYSVLLESTNLESSINSIRDLFKSNFPGNPFDYYFLEDKYNSDYKTDHQFGELFGSFAGLAVIIGCLGLFGLASYTTLQRIKEISIRKILGASVVSIVQLLSSQFIRLIVASVFIAFPIIWWGTETWLSQYPYRITISWVFFVIPLILLAVISLLSVSIQIIRAAAINPAKTLKQE